MKQNVSKKAMGMVKWFLPFYLFTFLPLSMMAQVDDDMYFVPTKKAVEKQKMTYGVPQNTYYAGSNRSVDDYNRRTQVGHFYNVTADSTANDVIDFDGQQGVYPDSVQQDFQLTREMSRWDGYEPNLSYWDGYADGRRDGAWHSPWFYNSLYPWYDTYWYDPWYMDRWYLYHDIYGPWYWGWNYYGYGYYSSWYNPWYYGYGYYAPYYPGYAVTTGTTGTQNHGRINYDGPRGASNGRSTAYSGGRFGGSRMGTTNRNSATSGSLGSRNSGTRTAGTTTTTAGRTTNAYGNFGGNRSRTATTSSDTRSYTPTTSSSSSSSSGSFGGSSGGSYGGSSGGGSFGGSRSSGGGGGGGGHFGGRR